MNEDKAARYNRLKRRASMASLAWSVALLAAAMWSGASLALRLAAERLSSTLVPAASGPVLTVVIYVTLLLCVAEIGGLPFSWYSGLVLERRYGLSNESAGGWALEQLKSFAVGILLSTGAASILYFFIRRTPDGWWLPAGAAFGLLIVGLANLAPVLLLPLFYQIKPLGRESLRARLLSLADRAGARVLGAYEWGLGARTKKANAALAGLGATRRILVSDTMLADYSEEEIEVVLAHEIGHHVHRDIWKALTLESALTLAGFWCAARVLGWAIVPLGLAGPGDPAGLPVLLLAAGAVSLVMLPATHAMSRAHERSADRFALQLTGNPRAFVSAMRRLATQNLAEEAPSRVTQWLFYSHPPTAERIATAQAFEP